VNFPKKVRVREVGPRDGFQIIPTFIETNKKIEIINLLSQTGLKEMQYTAFVHPKAIPQLRDAGEVTKGITQIEGVNYSGLIMNLKGLERAVSNGVKKVEFVISASDSHSISNSNATTEEALKRFESCCDSGYERCEITGGIAVALGCPFEGKVSVERLKWVCRRYVEYGIKEISLGDTTGMANPTQVHDVVSELLDAFPDIDFALHLHNTRGMALANIITGVQAGATIVDGAIAGLGGCPFAPGASGNVATEDVIHMFELMGVETGIELDKLLAAAKKVKEVVGHSDSFVLKAGKAFDLLLGKPQEQCNV